MKMNAHDYEQTNANVDEFLLEMSCLFCFITLEQRAIQCGTACYMFMWQKLRTRKLILYIYMNCRRNDGRAHGRITRAKIEQSFETIKYNVRLMWALRIQFVIVVNVAMSRNMHIDSILIKCCMKTIKIREKEKQIVRHIFMHSVYRFV